MLFIIWLTMQPWGKYWRNARTWGGRILYIAIFYGTPGFAFGELLVNGSVNRWVSLCLAALSYNLAIAYGVKRNKLKTCQQAVRQLSRRDATISYQIYPPEDTE